MMLCAMSIPSVSFHSWLLLTQSAHKFKMAVFWDTVDEYVLMMEAGSSFERSGHICQTKCHPVSEDRLHSHPRENLKSHQCCSLFNNFFSLFLFLSLPTLSHVRKCLEIFQTFLLSVYFSNFLHRLRILMTRLQNSEKRLLVLSCLSVRKQQLRSYRTDFHLI